MAGGEGRLGAEDGADLEDLVDAARDGHLLVELRGLGEVGGAVEVVDLEHLGPGLGGGAHEFRGVELGEALLGGDLAHGLLDRGLDGEHQLLRGPADVEETPVEALVQPGVLVDGQLRLGG